MAETFRIKLRDLKNIVSRAEDIAASGENLAISEQGVPLAMFEGNDGAVSRICVYFNDDELGPKGVEKIHEMRAPHRAAQEEKSGGV